MSLNTIFFYGLFLEFRRKKEAHESAHCCVAVVRRCAGWRKRGEEHAMRWQYAPITQSLHRATRHLQRRTVYNCALRASRRHANEYLHRPADSIIQLSIPAERDGFGVSKSSASFACRRRLPFSYVRSILSCMIHQCARILIVPPGICLKQFLFVIVGLYLPLQAMAEGAGFPSELSSSGKEAKFYSLAESSI